jgi:uncharacterized membrane protein YhhN
VTHLAWVLFGAAGALAALDWIAVGAKTKALEYVCKPGALAVLIGVAIALHPHVEARRAAFVVALILSLVGDVLLMLPRDRFVAGLGAFFLAHVAYIVGLRIDEPSIGPLLAGGAIVFLVAAVVGRPVLNAVREHHPDLGVPVSAYIAVISVMVACALATGEPLAATGALLFMASDSLIAWSRFVKPLAWAPMAIIVTYHLAQAGLVLSLTL